MILRLVVSRGPRRRKGTGWEDRLECGHSVTFDGARPLRRRCRQCERDAAAAQRELPGIDRRALAGQLSLGIRARGGER